MNEEQPNRPPGAKRTSTQRLRMAHGHLTKVVEMSENGEDHMNVLQQLSAVISALRSCSILLVLDHAGAQLENDRFVPEEFLRELEQILSRSIR